MHAMPQNEINELTTCKNTSLKNIKKNLLLAGYEVDSESEDHLTTRYMQVSGYGTSKDSMRFNIVKVDNNTFRFKVKTKADRTETVNAGGQTTTVGSGKNKINIQQDNKQVVQTSDESDQSYWVERRADYVRTQNDVCGSTPASM